MMYIRLNNPSVGTSNQVPANTNNRIIPFSAVTNLTTDSATGRITGVAIPTSFGGLGGLTTNIGQYVAPTEASIGDFYYVTHLGRPVILDLWRPGTSNGALLSTDFPNHTRTATATAALPGRLRDEEMDDFVLQGTPADLDPMIDISGTNGAGRFVEFVDAQGSRMVGPFLISNTNGSTGFDWLEITDLDGTALATSDFPAPLFAQNAADRIANPDDNQVAYFRVSAGDVAAAAGTPGLVELVTDSGDVVASNR